MREAAAGLEPESEFADDGSDMMRAKPGEIAGDVESVDGQTLDISEEPKQFFEWSVPLEVGPRRTFEGPGQTATFDPAFGPVIAPPLARVAPVFQRPKDGVDADGVPIERTVTRRQFDALDPITAAIGARWFNDGASFEWCREGPFNIAPAGYLDSRSRHKFTRYYMLEHVLIDVFANDSARVRAEVVEKTAAIEAHVRATGELLGYLPVIKGAFVDAGLIAAVKAGAILPLQTLADLPSAFPVTA